METNFRNLGPRKYALIAEMLNEISPMAFNACVDLFNPLLTNLSHIPFIYKELGKIYEHSMETRITTLGVLYKLYAPEKLHFTKIRTQCGIRELISKAMGFNSDEMVNEYQGKLVVYYKGPRFKRKIDEMAVTITKQIQEQDN